MLGDCCPERKLKNNVQVLTARKELQSSQEKGMILKGYLPCPPSRVDTLSPAPTFKSWQVAASLPEHLH